MLEDEGSGVGAYWSQLFPLLPFQSPYSIIRLIPVMSRCPFVYSSNAPMRPSQVALEVKNLPANAGDIRDVGLIPGSGRSPGGGNGITLQYSCLESSMDGGTWQTMVHGATESRIRLSTQNTV